MFSILCPTRKRPEMLQKMLESVRETQEGNVEILLSFDEDDKTKNLPFPLADYILTGKGSVGDHWNRMAEKASGDVLIMGNDDFLYITKSWDVLIRERVKETFPEDIYVAWCDDGSPRASKRCAIPIVSKKWIKTLGYFCPIGFKFFYHDTWIWELGKLINKTLYIPDILIEHRHVAFKKMLPDETSKRNRDDSFIHKHDKELFFNTHLLREEDAKKLRKKLL